MSSVIFIASDSPLMERPNPHDKMLSVNEALALGIKDIPEFMLEEGFDRNKSNVLLISDREVNINIDDGTIEDGNYDDDFCIWLTEDMHGMRTGKTFCAIFEWSKYTPGRAELLIEYLREQLKNTTEIELWHTWLDNELHHNIKSTKICIDDLRAEDILALEEKEVWKEPCIDYCYQITY